MTLDDTHSTGDSEDRQSCRWSIKSIPSTSRDNDPNEQRTDNSMSPQSHQLCTETLNRLPKGRSAPHLDINSSTDQGFQERQVKCAQDRNNPDIVHVAGITALVQECCDTIAQDYPQIDEQAEMLLGLQVPTEADPAPGIPGDFHADLEPNRLPRTRDVSPFEIDDCAHELPKYPSIQETYATAYQMPSVGMMPLGPIEAETMRREAAMDNAVFRPYRRSAWTVLTAARRTREEIGALTVRKQIRKRKRGEKDTV